MERRLKGFIYKICIFIILAFLCITILWSGTTRSVFAVSADSGYDQSEVLKDLEDSVISGKQFDVSDYPADDDGDLKIIAFAEYCYNFYTSEQDNYALYFYVYNPQLVEFDYDSTLNTVLMRVGGNAADEYIDYKLIFLDMSEGGDLQGRFLKYKIELSADEKSAILQKLDHSSRIYELLELELRHADGYLAEAYDISTRYTYTGFAAGYGEDAEGDSTLSCSVSGDVASISPEVHHTFYRAEGSNGTTTYTQDTLYSVYFSVPDELFGEYGELIEIRASWLKAMTQWAFVTGNSQFYDFVGQYMGLNMSDGENIIFPMEGANLADLTDYRIYAQDYDKQAVFDYGKYGSRDFSISGYAEYDGWFSGLYYAGADTDSADDYVVSSEVLLQSMEKYHDEYDMREDYEVDDYIFSTPYGGEYLVVNGVEYPYSKALFESWDSEETTADISADSELPSLTSVTLGKNFWESLFGGYHEVSSTEFDGIKAIDIITEDSFESTPALTCENLFIDTADYEDFADFYETAEAKGETVILLRFDVGEYSALETVLGTTNDSQLITPNIDIISTNGRIFKQNVYLNFDVIHLKFLLGDTVTTIGVIMDPITVIGDSTPAIDTSPDLRLDWWKTVLAVIALLFLIILLWPILPYIIKMIVAIITLPFKAIAALYRAIKNRGKDSSEAEKPKNAKKIRGDK